MYAATSMHRSAVGYWRHLRARTLIGAKREAVREYGDGFLGHLIVIGRVHDAGTERERIEPLCTRIIGETGWL
jgi:hypothetical protein